MYKNFFGLKEKPFNLLPDPEFLFRSKSHKRALGYLDYGINEGAAFILLTGEIGVGKTTIIRDLVRRHRDRIALSMIFNTDVDFVQLLTMINDDFGLPTQGKEKVSLLRDLKNFLIDQFSRGKKPVLIIDEAQNLAPGVLEEIRMLSNLETDKTKILQIILVGQPELRQTLSLSNLRQLRQRININCYINPLFRLELDEYILHRLTVAGNRDAVDFTMQALDVIYRCSRGNPRLINIICDFLMIYAYGNKSKVIDEAMAQNIVAQLDFEKNFCLSESSLEDDGEDVQGTIILNEVITPEMEFGSRLDEILLRLDRLEKEFVEFRQAVTRGMETKLSGPANSLALHIEESAVSDCSADKTNQEVDNNITHLPRLQKRNSKKGFFRRLFK